MEYIIKRKNETQDMFEQRKEIFDVILEDTKDTSNITAISPKIETKASDNNGNKSEQNTNKIRVSVLMG